MMGKLNWKGDHRSKDLSDKARVGGFVSIEELEKKPKVTSPSKQTKKRVPFLSLGRHSVSAKSLPADDDLRDRTSRNTPPLAADLFSNIPASAGLYTPWSHSTSPSRPRTSDATEGSFEFTSHKRSKTAPPATDAPHFSLNWADKPLPLILNFDSSRRRSLSRRSAQLVTQEDGRPTEPSASTPRATTRQSVDMKKSAEICRSRSDSIGSTHALKMARPTYSLTPTITPSTSRRPSISGTDRRPSFSADSRRGSQTVLTRTLSNAASPHTTRQRSNSQTSSLFGASTIGPPPARPAPTPTQAQPVFVDLEPSLSATIKEMQDLQGWYQGDNSKSLEIHNGQEIAKVSSGSEGHRIAPQTPERLLAREQSYGASAQTDQLPPYTGGPKIDTATTPPPALRSGSTSPGQQPVSLQRMQSIQIAYEKQKATMRKVNAENTTLRGQLETLQQRLDEVQNERSLKDGFEEAIREEQAKIEAVLHQLSVSRANEQTSQNSMSHVNRRLEEANEQKVDLLEESSILHETIASLRGEMEKMREENDALRQRPEASQVEELKKELLRIESENILLKDEAKSTNGRADLPAIVADLTFKLEDAQRITNEKDKYISELDTQIEGLSKDLNNLREDRAKLTEAKVALHVLKSHQARVNQLEQQTAELEKRRHAAQVEGDKVLQLMKEHLRRVAKDVHDYEHPASELLERKVDVKEAIAEVRLKAQKRLARADSAVKESHGSNPEDRIADLEKELDYHVKDIVLYKLDVKGYKKDIKVANKKIATLKESVTIPKSGDSTDAVIVDHKGRRRPSVTSTISSTGIARAVAVATVDNLQIITPRTTPEIPSSSAMHTHRQSSSTWTEKEVVPGQEFHSATAVHIAPLHVGKAGLPHIIQAWTPHASPRISPGVSPVPTPPV